MPTVYFRDEPYECKDSESLLDAFLRQKVSIPHACETGVCSTCLMRCNHGDVGESAVKGLNKALVAQGYFLSCQCYPKEELQVAQLDDFDLFGRARVVDKTMLSPMVCRLRLQSANPLYYRAGQYINLRNSDGIIRSYSLASLPSQDDFLEIHVKRMPNGLLSNWIVDFISEGDRVDFQGPNGLCFYDPDSPDARMLLAGTGAGLGPLAGIIRDALHSGHRGDIRLYHGEKDFPALYLHDYLTELQRRFDNFYYFPCLDTERNRDQANVYYGQVLDVALSDLKDYQSVYLCGSPAMVEQGRKQASEGGIPLSDIHTYPFETRDLRSPENQSLAPRVDDRRVAGNS
ncbi:MAG: 2Fe-2S iron-sulfur cluster-binding protein [Gammaproteobacteria bacterium]